MKITKAIPILGIRTKSTDLFTGGAGFNPQIDFNGDVGTDKVSKGVGELTLAVTGMDGNKIGTLKAPFTMIGVGYRKPRDGAGSVSALASYSSGKGFFGGLPKSMQHTYPIDKIEATANMLIPGVSSNFSHSGAEITGYASMDFTASEYDYSAYYVSGITSDSKIQFELNALLPSGEVEWKASLPIVVTYS
ncbi:fimbrial protein [Erwinia pyrifoliae]|uniref:F4 family fimbrial subunit n=1 Tax=Erwinia pyrifoliae TaxID=79967 RepID=UPI0034D963A6